MKILLLIIVLATYIIGNAVCFPLMNYLPMKSSKQSLSSLKMKSNKEIELENIRELLKINDSKEIEKEKIHAMMEIEAMKIADSEKERRLKSVLSLVYVTCCITLGAQLRDGLLGRVTTFNSIIWLDFVVQVLVGGVILKFVLKNLTRARSFLRKLFLR